MFVLALRIHDDAMFDRTQKQEAWVHDADVVMLSPRLRRFKQQFVVALCYFC